MAEKVRKAAGSVLREVAGLAVFGVGLLLLLSFASYSPQDYAGPRPASATHQNLCGPLGALASDALLRSFGAVSAIWAGALMIWGFLVVSGFAGWPARGWLAAFVLLVPVMTGLADLELPESVAVTLPSGSGGVAGAFIAMHLRQSVGSGGALIVLGLLAAGILLVTGTLRLSVLGRRAARAAQALRRLVLGGRLADGAAAAGEADAGGEAMLQARGRRSRGDAETDTPIPDFSPSAERHDRPRPKIFRRSEAAPRNGDGLQALAAELEKQLAEFKVEGKITTITRGPVVTTVEFEPSPGTKVAKIVGLADDLARLLKTQSLRVHCPVPGKNTVGFEIPNAERRTIRFGDLIEDPTFRSRETILPLALGVDTFGNPVVADLAEMPHLLIAGTTGSGKSVFLNTLIASLVCSNSAKQLRFVMVDPKMIELAAYGDLPHMACPVVTDARDEAQATLNGLVEEMESRFRRMGAVGARNIQAFNEIVRTRRKTDFDDYEGRWQPLPYIVLVVDEFADLILVNGKDTEITITRLAQKARAAGIHLVIATQRPSVSVVTGLIKANFTTRVAFRVLSGTDSRTILDQTGAETLLGKGDLMFQSAAGLQRLHGAFLDDTEVSKMVRACG
jgi:S-DNA-T family DNA segregation ATPase FtsK/SpoIIIE